MAKITSRANLTNGVEFTINTVARTITLNAGSGNLVAADGVTFQALYSKFVELWTTATYNEYPFPFYAIDALSGQFQIGTDGSRYNTWTWGNASTRTYIRDAGWSEYIATSPDGANTSATGTLQKQYVGIVTLGSVNLGAQLYFQNTSTGAATNFTYSNAVNEGILVYENGVSDNRTYFKGFVREYGYKYKDSVLADTGKTSTGAYLVNLLLSNETDLDIVTDDSTASTTTPYANTVVRYFANAFQKDIDTTGSPRNFGIVVDIGTHSGVDANCTSGAAILYTAAGGITGSNYIGGSVKIHNGPAKGTYSISGTPTAGQVAITTTFPATQANASFTVYRASDLTCSLKQLHTRLQYLLRQNSDIDSTSGTVIGKTAGLLSNFVGSRLDMGFYVPNNPNWTANTTIFGTGKGVVVEGVNAADINSIRFYDNTSGGTTYREYPYASAGTLTFNSNLTANSGVGSYYRLYYKDANTTYDYGFANAITVKDSGGANIAGVITASSIGFTYDYTNNNAGGQRIPGTDADVVLVAGNPGFAKPVVAFGTITQSKAIVVSATAEADRAFL